MTKDQFTFQFLRLAKAFSVTKPTERAEIYFEKLARFDATSFSKACDEVLSRDEKFPTVARLLGRCNELVPAEHYERQTCKVCDGYGNVFICGVSYRGACEHGERLSGKVRKAPSSEIGLQGEAIKQGREYFTIYGKNREPNNVMRNLDGKFPHWWIERDIAPERTAGDQR